ncbi:HNH endonuclease [Richelia sinica FACHB-800]|nr:HNH endonuclease [Richelia sinica FACHB-800]
MRCIFCKCQSSSSTSREHIIPESFGNKEHTLPPGVVCDRCNNYIAREIEKPLLDSPYFKEQRFNMSVPSKRNKIPTISGIHLQSHTLIEFMKRPNEDGTSIGAALGQNESRWIKSVTEQKHGTLIIPVASLPDDYAISRFLAKVGLESLASRLIDIEGGLDEIVDKPELNELRSYVRIGTPGRVWPYSCRSIYPPDFLFVKEGETFEVLHEYDILVTDSSEFYIVVALFGVEYALNLGGREIDGYYKWLQHNDNRSPLYSGKNTQL